MDRNSGGLSLQLSLVLTRKYAKKHGVYIMNSEILNQVEMRKAAIAALEENDFETVMTLARQNRKLLSILVRLAYNKETIVGWRAILAVGHVAALYVRNNYDFLRETIRKLLWSLSDESGGIGWSAPEILGEIVRADPKKMADVLPLIAEIYTIEEKIFRPGVLYALKRIAESQLEAVLPFQHLLVSGLTDNDPLSRIYSLELAKLLRETINPDYREYLLAHIKNLIADHIEAWIYEDEGFKAVEVGWQAQIVYNLYCNTQNI